MLTIHVNVGPASDQLGKVMQGFVTKIDTNEILDAAGAMLLNRTRTRYLSRVDPDLIPWLPSKAGLKRMASGGTGTLFKTGTLYHSIQLHKVDDNERAISTDVPYGKYHQNPTSGVMRKFLGFNDDDQNMFSLVVQTMVNRALKA